MEQASNWKAPLANCPCIPLTRYANIVFSDGDQTQQYEELQVITKLMLKTEQCLFQYINFCN